MKKQIISVFTLCMLLISFPCWCYGASITNPTGEVGLLISNVLNYEADEDITITIDGQKLETKMNPVIINGIAFVSAGDFQAISDCLISWSSSRKEITVISGQTVAILKIASKTALINNKLEAMPAAPFITNGNTMLPVKYTGNAIGFGVTWDKTAKEITITSPAETLVSTIPALARLSYDDAIKTGIQKSPDYQSSLLSKDRAKSQDDNLLLSSGTYNLQLLKTKQDLKLYNNWADKQISLVMEQVANSVKNQMDDLSLLFVEKKNQQDKIDLMAEKLRIERISYDYGITSLQSLMTVQNNYHSEIQNLTILEQRINATYTRLNQTLGHPADYRNTLEYDIAYEPIGNVNLDYKIIDDTASDPFIWYANQNVDSKEFKLNLYEYNMGGQSWTLTALDLTEARKNLHDTKTALAGVIRDRYNSLIQLEEQIRLLELTLDQARDSVNAIRLQYDLGNAIKLQVDEAQMAIPALEYQIQGLKQQHSQLKMLFEKPYLAPTYVKSA